MVGRHTDLVIVDLAFPGEDGLGLIAHLHTNTRLVIIALTARGSAADQTSGIDAGWIIILSNRLILICWWPESMRCSVNAPKLMFRLPMVRVPG